MSVTMTGAQYKAFLSSKWGPDAYWEDTEILKNGEPVEDDCDSDQSIYADTDTVTILCGTIIPDQSQPPSLVEYVDAVKFARKWLKADLRVPSERWPHAQSPSAVPLLPRKGGGYEGR